MSVNKHKPHLLILPEDQAYTDLANGFELHPAVKPRIIHVLNKAGGWHKVLDVFQTELPHLAQFPQSHLLMLLDCDDEPDRLIKIRAQDIPENLQDRVFVLGALPEPERLKSHFSGGYQAIGIALAQDCADNTSQTWGHATLQHNVIELKRMATVLKPFLFS